MSLTIIKGTILSAPTLGQLDALPGGYLVAEDGLIRGVYGSLPEQYAGAPVEDWGDALILQSFADLHLHAPQYPMLGMGMDLPLLDWLNAYAFPTEARFADTGYAREIYSRLARELIANGTTRVCMFSSLHTDATLILMEELEKAGVTSFHVTLANHGELSDTIPPRNHPEFGAEGCFLKFCDQVRALTQLPICGVGGLTDPDFVEEQLRSGRIDCAAMSRQLTADPDWPRKVREDRTREIRRCVRCNKACLGGMMAHKGVHCIYERKETT